MGEQSMITKEDNKLLNTSVYVYDKHSADDLMFKGTGYNKVIKLTLKDVFNFFERKNQLPCPTCMSGGLRFFLQEDKAQEYATKYSLWLYNLNSPKSKRKETNGK
jgi:hypothetical protein